MVSSDPKLAARALGGLVLRHRSSILVVLLTLLMCASAMCAAQTAAASTFPGTESLDTFERAAENPLSDGGKWSKFSWTKTIGRVYSSNFGWVPKEGGAGATESEADGAYWNAKEFTAPAVSTRLYAENLHNYVGIWADTNGNGAKNGYRLKVLGTGTSYGFKLILEKWVGGTRTQLGESAEVPFKGLSSENVIGLTAINGKVSGWYGTSEAGLAVKVEASDSTFNHGNVGIEGTNDDAYGETQYRASAGISSFPATESLDTFERAAENPLSNGGKWSKFAWTKTIGRVYSATFGWVPKEGGAGAAESEADGAWWNAKEFTAPAVSTRMYAENLHDYVGLWGDSTGAGSKSGYRLKASGRQQATGSSCFWKSGWAAAEPCSENPRKCSSKAALMKTSSASPPSTEGSKAGTEPAKEASQSRSKLTTPPSPTDMLASKAPTTTRTVRHSTARRRTNRMHGHPLTPKYQRSRARLSTIICRKRPSALGRGVSRLPIATNGNAAKRSAAALSWVRQNRLIKRNQPISARRCASR